MDTQYRFKFISLFAGCGGSSLGYHWAGGKELLAVEWDDNAVETFKLNFPGIPVYYGDIAKLSIDECLQLAGIQPGKLDILDGSPPCQGFSTAGKRQMSDSRNQLFQEYVRLLRGLKPKVFVMENVSGLVKGKMKLIFAEIMRELKASGYRVKCQLMNAMYFNVPQSRERVIFIGVREDLDIEPSHPKAQARPITVEDALKGIVPKTYVDLTGWGLKAWNVVGEGMDLGKYDVPFAKGFEGHGHHKVSPREVCPTIKKHPAFTNTALMHWLLPRSMAIEELKILSSFPNSFQLIGDFKEQWARIGNSVPPRFMQAIAEHIRDNILSDG